MMTVSLYVSLTDSEAAVAADDIGEHYVSTEMESGSRGWLHTEELSEKNDERLAYERIMYVVPSHVHQDNVKNQPKINDEGCFT